MKRAALAAAVAVLAAVAAASLASAAAPTRGRLIVSNPAVNASALGQTTISAILAPNTYRTTVYVPAGYRAAGGLGAVGNNVGKATVFAKQADGSRVTLNGQLSVVPASQVPDTSCSSVSGTHAAVWMLKANQSSGTATISFPVYVDTNDTNPKMSAAHSLMLQFCSGNRGLTVSEVDFDLVKMLVNPAARGMYLWRAVYEPLASDGKTIMSASSVGVAAAVPINSQVTMNVKHLRNTHLYTFSGNVNVVKTGLANVKVQIYVGHQQRLALNKPNATVRTKGDGSYRVTLRLSGKGHWYARAKASTPYQDVTAGGGCSSTKGDGLATNNCVDATLAPFVVLSAPVKRLS